MIDKLKILQSILLFFIDLRINNIINRIAYDANRDKYIIIEFLNWFDYKWVIQGR